MAGVTDRPFRQLCRDTGAAAAVSEMVSVNPELLKTRKTRLRLDHSGESSPKIVQIAGSDPGMMAQAARFNVDRGAEIIDINMGCPAKKVCNALAGSALLRDEALVGRILEQTVNAVGVPVTLKIRTGWDMNNRNAVRIALIAEQTGIAALTVHGRTRACGFRGRAEHDTTAEIKTRIGIPVIANGDIDSAEEAARVLGYTNADAVMIGRAAQGNPWIFREVNHYLATGELPDRPANEEVGSVLIKHLTNLYDFYGEYTGTRVARKHVGWYCRRVAGAGPLLALINQADSGARQLQLVGDYFANGGYGKLAA